MAAGSRRSGSGTGHSLPKASSASWKVSLRRMKANAAPRRHARHLRPHPPKAKAVVAYGTCAAFGGDRRPSPTPPARWASTNASARRASGHQHRRLPQNPLNRGHAGRLLRRQHRARRQQPPHDVHGSVHDQCERRERRQRRIRSSFDSEARNGWCLYELGCKGRTL